MNYPWHDNTLDALLAGRANLHHALLLEGAPGTGRRAFAFALASALLCETPDPRGRACGSCLACGWFAQRNHPDFRRIQPDAQDPEFVGRKDSKPSRHIRIEQIRSIAGFVNVGAHRGGRKIVMIDPAEAMNVIAANGLLKTLEEPPGDTVFILVSGRPDGLPPTIRSRCLRVRLPMPDRQQAGAWLVGQTGASDADASRWLAAAGGAPLAALELAEPAGAAAHRTTVEALATLPETSPVEAAERLVKIDPRDWMPWVQAWISDLARVLGGAAPRFLPDRAERLRELAGQTSLERILGVDAAVARLAPAIEHPLNPRLFVESVLLRYCEAFER